MPPKEFRIVNCKLQIAKLGGRRPPQRQQRAANPQDHAKINTYRAKRKVSYDHAAYEVERQQCAAQRAKSNGNGECCAKKIL